MWLTRHTLSKYLLIMGLLVATTGFASPIYKATLPDGRVIYTDDVDSAYKQVTDNSQITVLDNLEGKATTPLAPQATPAMATPTPLPAPTDSTPSDIGQLVSMNISSTEASQTGDYQLRLISPQNQMVYHRPAQQVDITLTLQPALRPADRLRYAIDEKQVQQSSKPSLSVASTDIDPGKHTVTVSVINAMNQPIASATADFYVILTNPLIKKQKEIIAKRTQYDALPWYKKVGMHLKGDAAPLDPKKIDMNHVALDPTKTPK